MGMAEILKRSSIIAEVPRVLIAINVKQTGRVRGYNARHPMKSLLISLVVSALIGIPVRAADAPKRLLVVTVTLGYRHSSIPTAEKVLSQLAEKSGAFTVDFVHQPEDQPQAPHKPAPLPGNAAPDAQAAYNAALGKYDADEKAFAPAMAAWMDRVKDALQKLSPESLKNYDGVVFANTTGDLPIPDKDGFLNWIREGHAFIAMHSASDTFHHWPGYLDMLGGEFLRHGRQLGVNVINMDPKNPATAGLPPSWAIKQEEIYNFKDYDPAKVHELLTLGISPLDNTPGHFPVSWCKMYGKGRVFYTSLGHREDIWDTDPAIPNRINPPEVAQKYQDFILGGIKWALGLEPGDATPQLQ
jgi:uncharacterized protein